MFNQGCPMSPGSVARSGGDHRDASSLLSEMLTHVRNIPACAGGIGGEVLVEDEDMGVHPWVGVFSFFAVPLGVVAKLS